MIFGENKHQENDIKLYGNWYITQFCFAKYKCI